MWCREVVYEEDCESKKITKKVLIDFPISPRLQRLYAIKNVVEHMTWHQEHPHADNFMERPRDGEV